ncbi:MAG: sensor histidine kinase [Thalassotalea sp.]
MALIKSKSLETFIVVKLGLLFTGIALLIALLAWQYGISFLWIIVVLFSVFLYSFWYIVSFKRQVMRAYTRSTLHVDAISQEDYNQFGKSAFSQGKVKALHQQLKQLSEKLQQQKSNNDQHVYLVYQLIAQLDAPIIIFNQSHQLTFGNDAFYHLFNQSWQMFRHASPELLGLEYQQSTWSLIDKSKRAKWQIRHSEFIHEGEQHQLLVFINIEPALRESQLNAWQQIIRVLSHEIRNSLTPVSSMAETLADKSNDKRDQQVLGVITERCLHLQSFVERYSSLSRQFSVHSQPIPIDYLVNKVLAGLFKQLTLTLNASTEHVFADRALLEQVLINLVKNSAEAGATKVSIDVGQQDQYTILEIADNGHGFTNINNLFVPLYTTKKNGQGIGLNFCRNIIEQHGGIMELHNNDEKGVTVMLLLPTA